jgi:hypothetical protein
MVREPPAPHHRVVDDTTGRAAIIGTDEPGPSRESNIMIVTTPDSPLAFTMIRPVTPSSSRPGLEVEPAEVTASRIARRALVLAGASLLLVVLAL